MGRDRVYVNSHGLVARTTRSPVGPCLTGRSWLAAGRRILLLIGVSTAAVTDDDRRISGRRNDVLAVVGVAAADADEALEMPGEVAQIEESGLARERSRQPLQSSRLAWPMRTWVW